MSKELIAVGIMAHNEEKVIGKCIDCILLQELREKYELEIFVVANACTDRTVEIVQEKCVRTPNLHLVEVLEKGKSRAIRVFKEKITDWNERQSAEDKRIQKLLFIDADIFFETEDAVYQMAETLNRRADLSAILPASVHKMDDGCKSVLVWHLYEAKTILAFAVKGTAFSGQCYMIRNEVAQRIEIPNYIMAEDFYISERLRGGYFRDYNIKYTCSLPTNFRAEIKRIFRHKLANAQMRSFFGHGLFQHSVVQGTVPVEKSLYDRGTLVREWRKLRWDHKLLILLFYLIGKVGEIRAKVLIRKYGAKNIKILLEQWQTIR